MYSRCFDTRVEVNEAHKVNSLAVHNTEKIQNQVEVSTIKIMVHVDKSVTITILTKL